MHSSNEEQSGLIDSLHHCQNVGPHLAWNTGPVEPTASTECMSAMPNSEAACSAALLKYCSFWVEEAAFDIQEAAVTCKDTLMDWCLITALPSSIFLEEMVKAGWLAAGFELRLWL